ncbi:hypothetical protein [Salinibacterium sp. M195]|uniref:hypothetical protein n=1 Tax=Salinibacterium sp. M195 TaxID=2583374 RepID=UPI001C62B283|nr:hypothetical protein [Salinibacterium sp. M195]QYH35912.1 hypothetical protein FFT87_08080 [Salinibacterium sp. M195]
MPKNLEVALDSMSVPAPDFDVREYANEAQASYRDTLNLESYASAPLTPETIRALRYLQVVERGTMTHLRSVLVTATHKDSRVTAFLITWAFEKYWIADALDQIIRSHDGADADRAPFRTPVERTIRESIVANIVGLPMIAVHMTLGTVDEWLMQAAYRRVLELDPNPQLTATLTHIVATKSRQLEFFEAQSRHRLAESTRAQKVTRKRLAKTPWPIGARAEPRKNTDFFFEYLFRSKPETIRSIDALIDSLDGQTNLNLMTRAAAV